VTLLVARFLLPFDYGVLTASAIFIGLADILAEAGVGKALVRLPRLGTAEKAEGFTLSLMLGLAVYAALFVVAGPAATFMHNPALTDYVRIVGLLLLLIPFRAVPLAILERDLRLGRLAVVHVAITFVQAMLTLALAANGAGYWSLAGGVFASRVLEAALLARTTRWVPRLRVPGETAVGILRFGLNISGASLLWYVYSNSDFMVVGRLAGPIELGYYSLAFSLMSLPVQKLSANINQVAYPFFCRMHTERPRLKRWYLKLIALIGAVTLPCFVGAVIVADDGIAVALGAKWLPAVPSFRILCILGAIMCVSSTLPPLLNALGRADVNFRYTLTCACLFPAGFYLAGSWFGVIGVCLVWVTIYPAIIAGLFTLTRGITGVGLTDLFGAIRPALLATALMAVAVLAARHGVPADNRPLRLLTCVAAGVVSYAILIRILGKDLVYETAAAIFQELRPARAD
jgi:O-antigen/teichoic acid export membrane protein